MALPIIANSVPKYDMVIPSSKKKIRFRPFLVKEQKTLLIAYESKDKTAMIRAMIDTIESCVTDDIDVYKLSTFDIDYLFAQIRAKSVGENTQLLLIVNHAIHRMKLVLTSPKHVWIFPPM